MTKRSLFSRLLICTLTAILLPSCADQHFARKYYEKAKAEAPYDAVIVAGIPYIDSTSSGLLFLARVRWAVYLYKHGITKNIIFSGAAVSTPYYEGLAMKITADSLGVPPEHIFAELRSEHSTENVWYSMKMAHKLGFKKIALATDAFQTKLLRGFMRKRCNNIPYIPIVYDSVIADRHQWQSQMPKVDFAGAFKPGYIPLAQRESFSERFRGTMGRHIDFSDSL